jgi:hypothetical protein
MSFSGRQIVRAAKLRGWTIQPDALEAMEGYLQHESDPDALNKLLDTLKERIENKTIKVSQLESILNSSKKSKTRRLESNSIVNVQVINAFDQPKLIYVDSRKRFLLEQKTYPIFGSPEDKVRKHIESPSIGSNNRISYEKNNVCILHCI